MALHLRPLTEEEERVLTRLSRSTKEEARLVDRAKLLLCAREGFNGSQVAQRMGWSKPRARTWIRRFNEQGLEGILDAPRSGAPMQYEAQVRARVIATALSSPKNLGLPFASWTMERLACYLHEQGIRMGKTRMFEILQEEGLRWRKQEGWFGQRVDPDFARAKGGSRTPAQLPSRTLRHSRP
ncbi:MAG TPA: helix-turn-helix domain-containing protein [Ktedonobacteraceae bacterium]